MYLYKVCRDLKFADLLFPLSADAGPVEAGRVKCDTTRPECNRCGKAGLECEGYHLKLYWVTDEDTIAPSAIKRQAMSLEGTAGSGRVNFLNCTDAMLQAPRRGLSLLTRSIDNLQVSMPPAITYPDKDCPLPRGHLVFSALGLLRRRS